MELGCSHLSAGALPQADPSEQDYSPAVKQKLLSQSRVPFLECSDQGAGSGGEISPEADGDTQ